MESNTLWKQSFSLEEINRMSEGTIARTLDIRFEEIGPDFLTASMPVDKRTVQPAGLLHGGASVVLAETLGSVASILCLNDLEQQAAVGVEVNANHLMPVTKGRVSGTVRPIRIGSKIHVWNIEITDESDRKSCASRLTTMIINRKMNR